ncbi:MAG: CRTAC1 family protein [Thermoguttaceae bacterium]
MKALHLLLLGLLILPAVPAHGEEDLPVFEDVTERAGIDFKHNFGSDHLSNIVEGTGSGCMFFDYDGDGWLDIYLVNGRYRSDVNDNSGRKYRGKLTNKLYRNNHDGTFTDVTEKAGVGGGDSYGVACSAADYDRDGHLDLLVLNYGPPILYHNNGDGTFTDVTKKAGLAADARWGVSGLWLDYNNDGLLDLFIAHYLQYDSGKFRSYYPAAGYPGPLSYNGTANALYRNNGNGTFTDVTKEAGVYKPNGRAMSATAADLNNHGLLDIYVANDSMENYYFRNTGKGKFVEEALQRGIAFGEGGQGVSNMGPTIADLDRNGLLDIFIPNLGYGTLWRNKGKYFEDRTSESGLAVICGQYAGWGSALIDYDNDGYLDVFVATGGAHHLHPEESVLARNDGKGHFVDVSKRSGKFFQQKFVARGVAYGDFNNDGKMDLLVMTLDGAPHLLRNVGGAKNHWLTVVPKLSNGKSDAIGARVTVKTGGLVQIHDVIPVTGYLSQSDPRPHFGLAKATKADVVEIRWPNGRMTTLKDVKADQFLKVVQEKP